MPSLVHIARRTWSYAGYPGLLSGLVSAAALLWRGSSELRRAVAPINAPSHWVWGSRALRANQASWRYTGLGTATHLASAMLWGALFDALRRRRKRLTTANAMADAAVVTATAACVDFVVVPKRLTPGFEHRLSKRGLIWVYAGFGVGLVMGAAITKR